MQKITPSPLYQKSSDLALLTYKFAETYRANMIPGTPHQESDTDHTVMLGLIATALADQYAPTLNTSKVAEYALIHDLVEVYAGDTVTITPSEEQKADKVEREALALERIRREFDDTFPWIGKVIESYEHQNVSEARFVRVVDKLLPGLGHIKTDCITFKSMALGPEEIRTQIKKTNCLDRGLWSRVARDSRPL